MASQHQNKVKRQLESEGWWVIKLIRCGENGIPDLLALKEGEAMFIECKELKDTVKLLQQHQINRLKKAGFTAYVDQSLI